MRIFYHDDADGQCAAAIVKRAKGQNKEITFVPIRNHDVFPISDIDPMDEVYIVDYTPKPGMFYELLGQVHDVTWIDHHERAISEIGEIEGKIQGVRKNGIAACRLAWEYFYPDTKLPRAVELIADHDTHHPSKCEYGDETRFFVAGLSVSDHRPKSKLWFQLLTPDNIPTGLVKQGGAVVKYRTQQNKKAIDERSFKIGWHPAGSNETYNCIICNSPIGSGAELFDSVQDRELYDIFVRLEYDAAGWHVSMHTERDDVDVSAIAVRYGGGGHRKAAGFRCDELPF